MIGTLANPVRERNLFLHKKDIFRLIGKIREKGLTLVPTELYLKGTLIKVEVALVRGRTKHDKRNVLKNRTLEKEARSALRKYSV
jgi:SsrA-binding protein